jgi:hypothetical protein
VHEEATEWDGVAEEGDDENSEDKTIEEQNERNDGYCTFLSGYN